MPFYRRLAARIGDRVQLVAVSNETGDVLQNYLSQNRLAVKRSVSFAGKVQGTPTLVLVNKAGVIKNAWVGLQNESGENDIVRAIDRDNP